MKLLLFIKIKVRDLMYKKLKGNCKKIAIADDDEKKLYQLAWTEI